MTKNHLALRQAGRLMNRRTLRLLAAAGTVMAVCAAVMSALGALLMVRQLRLVSAQQKALPVLRRAAEVYLEKNGSGAPELRRKRFFAPKKKAEELPVEAPGPNEQEEVPF